MYHYKNIKIPFCALNAAWYNSFEVIVWICLWIIKYMWKPHLFVSIFVLNCRHFFIFYRRLSKDISIKLSENETPFLSTKIIVENIFSEHNITSIFTMHSTFRYQKNGNEMGMPYSDPTFFNTVFTSHIWARRAKGIRDTKMLLSFQYVIMSLYIRKKKLIIVAFQILTSILCYIHNLER